jgi:hypothetical protein
MLTAGPVSTTDDTPVDAIADTSALGGRKYQRHIEVINHGDGDAFYSFNDGESWAFLPAGGSAVKDDVTIGGRVQVKRVAGQSNVTDLYVSLW